MWLITKVDGGQEKGRRMDNLVEGDNATVSFPIISIIIVIMVILII